MTELKAEAIRLIEQMPEEKMESAVEALKFYASTKDPFWSAANQRHLRESVAQFEAGKWQEHELIDD